MGTFIGFNPYPQQQYYGYSPSHSGGTATTLAVGEEGGGYQSPQYNSFNPLLLTLLQGPPGQGISIDKFNQFHKDADTQGGKVTGDGLLTKSEIEDRLDVLKNQQQTYQIFGAISPQSQPFLQFLMRPLALNIQIGQSMLDNFNTFATATNQFFAFPYTEPTTTTGNSITLDEIKIIAARDGNDKYISLRDINPGTTATASTSFSSSYTSF